MARPWRTLENTKTYDWLVTEEDRYKKLVMKPNFKDGRKFSKNLMGVEMGKLRSK